MIIKKVEVFEQVLENKNSTDVGLACLFKAFRVLDY